MNRYTVYKHTCPNSKVYIGITSQNPIKRWGGGYGYHKNIHFYRAILKYGWDNIQHEIITSELSESEAKDLEIELISKYKSNNPKYGYNQTKGGDAFPTIPEKSRIVITQKITGKKRTPEQIKHYIEGAAKRPKRLHLSIEHKENISKSLLGNKRALGNITNRVKVAQYTLDGVFIKYFDCSKLAAEEINCDSSGINRCCRENAAGNLKNTKYKGKYKGFRWYYVDKK